MGPHGICMRFVFRNMLTLSLSLSIGVAEATPRQWSNDVPRTVRSFSSGEILQFALSVFTRYSALTAVAKSFTTAEYLQEHQKFHY